MASLLFKGGHLGFKSTEGAGVGAYSGKAGGGGRGSIPASIEGSHCMEDALKKGPSLRFTYLDRHLCHHKELFNADKQPTKEGVLK